MLNSSRAFREGNSRTINIPLLPDVFFLRICLSKPYSPAPCATYYFSQLYFVAAAWRMALTRARKLRLSARAG